MKPKLRRHLPGNFLVREHAGGAWRLSRGGPPSADIIVQGADSRTSAVLRSPEVADIDIEWQDAAVELTLWAGGHRRSLQARSAIVHEPLTQLYDALPLVTLDAKARRFWRRVFLLVRIPGGRYLLGAMARRTRPRR